MTDATNAPRLMPERVKLAPKEVSMLNKITAKQAALDSFVKTIMAQGEARLSELGLEQKDVWDAIGKAHGIDLQKVDYKLEDDTLIPVRLVL